MSNLAIVCVDDEIAVLRSLEMELEKAFGDTYVYEFAESAAEALELLQELQQNDVEIRMIISDWLMPGMKGDELLIQVHRQYPNIITVLLTGQAVEEVIQRTQKNANLYEYLPKPWPTQKFIATVQSALTQ
jgi:CheY-like chemotaxis protein